MSEQNINDPEKTIEVNMHDGAVAVDEKDRTVLLTNNETIIVEKPEQYNIIPNDRPRKVYGGMWGPLEVGALGAAVLVILAAMGVFFFLTLPAKRELEAHRTRKNTLEQELLSSRTKYGDITSTETQVAKLVSSVDQFETQYLPVASNGRTSLYQRLNNLIGAYGLVNTSGPDYAPLEMADAANGAESEEERGRARFRSLFPGAYVTMTLEGPYQNLRRFIRDIETGNEFIIISSIELEPSDSQSTTGQSEAAPVQDDPMLNQPNGGFPGTGRMPGPQQMRPKGRTLGEVVSLRMEMAAYFRRSTLPAVQPEAPGVQ
jgi:hypothetical protein